MGPVLGELLPLAVGVAISPVPIIAVILMLFAPRSGVTSAGFLTGWLVGIAAACGIFVVLGSALGGERPGGAVDGRVLGPAGAGRAGGAVRSASVARTARAGPRGGDAEVDAGDRLLHVLARPSDSASCSRR